MATTDKNSKDVTREGRKQVLKRLQRQTTPRKLPVSAAEVIRALRGE